MFLKFHELKSSTSRTFQAIAWRYKGKHAKKAIEESMVDHERQAERQDQSTPGACASSHHLHEVLQSYDEMPRLCCAQSFPETPKRCNTEKRLRITMRQTWFPGSVAATP